MGRGGKEVMLSISVDHGLIHTYTRKLGTLQFHFVRDDGTQATASLQKRPWVRRCAEHILLWCVTDILHTETVYAATSARRCGVPKGVTSVLTCLLYSN